MRYIDSSEERTSIRNIYIFPTRSGWIFLLAVVVMWLFGANYDNNLILLTALFAGAAFCSALFMTWANLRGIVIFPESPSREVKAGDGVPVSFRVDTNGRTVFGVRLTSKGQAPVAPVDLKVGSSLSVVCPDGGRGVFRLPRFKVFSDFPLGLMRASFYVEHNDVVTVYPRPISCEFLPEKDIQGALNHHEDGQSAAPVASLGRGADEISGLRKYRGGDPLNLVDWKQLARGRGLMVREFSPDVSSCVCLKDTSVRALAYEERISMIAHAVNVLAGSGIRFSLDFAGIRLSPNAGDEQRHRAQRALALLPKEGA